MLKIEVIKFEAQDVITTSVVEAPQGICYCDDDCGYQVAGKDPLGAPILRLQHSQHDPCSDCKFTLKIGP